MLLLIQICCFFQVHGWHSEYPIDLLQHAFPFTDYLMSLVLHKAIRMVSDCVLDWDINSLVNLHECYYRLKIWDFIEALHDGDYLNMKLNYDDVYGTVYMVLIEKCLLRWEDRKLYK